MDNNPLYDDIIILILIAFNKGTGCVICNENDKMSAPSDKGDVCEICKNSGTVPNKEGTACEKCMMKDERPSKDGIQCLKCVETADQMGCEICKDIGRIYNEEGTACKNCMNGEIPDLLGTKCVKM